MGRDEEEDEPVKAFSAGDFAAFESDEDPFMTDEVPRPPKPAPHLAPGQSAPEEVEIGPHDTVLHTRRTDWVELSELIPERHSDSEVELWVRVEAGLDPDGNAMLRFPDGLPPLYLVQFLFEVDDADSIARIRAPASGRTYALFVPHSIEEPIVHGVAADGSTIAVHVPDGTASAIAPEPDAPLRELPTSFTVYETKNILVDATRAFGNPDLFVTGLDSA